MKKRKKEERRFIQKLKLCGTGKLLTGSLTEYSKGVLARLIVFDRL